MSDAKPQIPDAQRTSRQIDDNKEYLSILNSNCKKLKIKKSSYETKAKSSLPIEDQK